MARTKLGLTDQPRAQVAALAKRIHRSLKDNPDFPNPNPDLPTLASQIAALEAGLLELAGMRANLRAKVSELNGLTRTVKESLAQLAAYVENTARRNPVKILSAGMEPRKDREPLHMPRVERLEGEPGIEAGTVRLTWRRVVGRSFYEIDWALETDQWKHLATSLKRSIMLPDLPGGAMAWFRVRAVSAKGPGPWSDPASARVR
jgi:hypothetical protein